MIYIKNLIESTSSYIRSNSYVTVNNAKLEVDLGKIASLVSNFIWSHPYIFIAGTVTASLGYWINRRIDSVPFLKMGIKMGLDRRLLFPRAVFWSTQSYSTETEQSYFRWLPKPQTALYWLIPQAYLEKPLREPIIGIVTQSYPIHCGASTHPEVTRVLLERGLDPNIQDGKGNTPLHCALKSKNWPCARALQKANRLNPNIRNQKEKLPLHYATHCPEDIVEKLLNEEQNYNSIDSKKRLPAHYAAIEGNVNFLQKQKAAQLDAQDHMGRTPLHLVCLHRHYKAAQEILGNPHVNANLADNSKLRPLELVLRSASSPEARNLIEQFVKHPSINPSDYLKNALATDDVALITTYFLVNQELTQVKIEGLSLIEYAALHGLKNLIAFLNEKGIVYKHNPSNEALKRSFFEHYLAHLQEVVSRSPKELIGIIESLQNLSNDLTDPTTESFQTLENAFDSHFLHAEISQKQNRAPRESVGKGGVELLKQLETIIIKTVEFEDRYRAFFGDNHNKILLPRNYISKLPEIYQTPQGFLNFIESSLRFFDEVASRHYKMTFTFEDKKIAPSIKFKKVEMAPKDISKEAEIFIEVLTHLYSQVEIPEESGCTLM